MPLNIKSPETDQLARRLAERTGESITDAITVALRERLDRLDRQEERTLARLAEFRKAAQQLPVLDHRSGDEILGYDQQGLPT